MLSEEVNNAPAAVPHLNVSDRERRNLRPPQATAQENGEDRPIAEALIRRGVRSIQQRLRLPDREPIPKADAFGCHPLYAGDPAGQLGRQQSIVGRLDRQFPDGGDPNVNRD